MMCTFTGREVIRGVHRKEVCVWKEVIHGVHTAGREVIHDVHTHGKGGNRWCVHTRGR